MRYRVSKLKNSIYLAFVLAVFTVVCFIINAYVDGLSLRCTAFATAGAGIGLFVIPVILDFRSYVMVSDTGIEIMRRGNRFYIAWGDIRRLEYHGWLKCPINDAMIIHISTVTDIRRLPVIDFSFKNQRKLYIEIVKVYREKVPDGIVDAEYLAIEKNFSK